jgi:hypothetical protein
MDHRAIAKEELAQRLYAITQKLLEYDEMVGPSCPQSQHILRDVMNVEIGKFKYGRSANIKGAKAVASRKFPMTNAASTAKQVIREHAVPVIYLANLLKQAQDWRDCLLVVDLFTIAVLAKHEDDALKYKTKMPAGWQPTDCPFARYATEPFYEEILSSEAARNVE